VKRIGPHVDGGESHDVELVSEGPL
jgi:hypothetical protein